METLLGGIIRVVSEKYGLDYRDKSSILNKFFKLSHYREYDEMIRNICFSIESSSKNVTLAIGSVMKEIKLKVVEKYVFLNFDKNLHK